MSRRQSYQTNRNASKESVGFFPTRLSGTVLWLRSDQGITQASNLVSQWNDLSGLGNNAVQAVGANQITWHTGGAGGQPYLQQSDASRWMTGTFASSFTVNSVAIVCDFTANANTFPGPFASVNNAQGISTGASFLKNGANVTARQSANGLTRDATGGGIFDGLPHICIATNDTFFTSYYQDSAATATVTSPTSSPNTPDVSTKFIVGALTASSGNSWGGKIYEIIQSNRVWTANEIRSICQLYLSPRYGIPISE